MESIREAKAKQGQEESAKKKRRGGNESVQFLRKATRDDVIHADSAIDHDASSLQIGTQVTLTIIIFFFAALLSILPVK